MRSPVADAIAALAAVVQRLGVRWYLFGAQAALLYGAARVTADVDITVELGAREPEDLIRAFRKAGFGIRVRDARGFVATTRVLPLVHRRSAMPIDVVLAGPGLEELFFTRRRRRVVEGVRVPVASPEDIIVMKIIAGRAKDMDDVTGILAAQRKLNVDLVVATLASVERALDTTDLRRRFEELFARAGRPSRRSRRR
jgi:hypothetical protein